jgi:hypothetical protein
MEKTLAEQHALAQVVENLKKAVLETIKKSGFIFFRRNDETKKEN